MGRTFGDYDLPEDLSTLTVLSFTAGLLGRMRRQLKLLKIETGEKLYNIKTEIKLSLLFADKA